MLYSSLMASEDYDKEDNKTTQHTTTIVVFNTHTQSVVIVVTHYHREYSSFNRV